MNACLNEDTFSCKHYTRYAVTVAKVLPVLKDHMTCERKNKEKHWNDKSYTATAKTPEIAQWVFSSCFQFNK